MKKENETIVLTEKEHLMETGMLNTLVKNLIEFQCRQIVKEQEGRLVDDYDRDLIDEACSKALRLLYRRTKKDGENFEDFGIRKLVEVGETHYNEE